MSQQETPPTKIQLTCKILEKYYASFGVNYDAIFSTWCDGNGIDDDAAVQEEFESYDPNNPTDWMLAGFIEKNTFPFKKKPINNVDKCISIYKLMSTFWDNCNNPDFSVDCVIKIHQFKAPYFEIEEENITQIKKIYQAQCPALFNSGMENDRSFLKLLAIGHKNNFNYLQCLVDDFFRDRIAHISKQTTPRKVEEWQRKHKHFQAIKEIPFSTVETETDKKIVSTSQQPQTVIALVLAAVQSFKARVCPMLYLQPRIKINDSLDHITRYIQAGFKFIANVFDIASDKKTFRVICPFQFDMCIVSNKPQNIVTSVKLDDDDDDEKDDEKSDDTFVDCVGNIENKLKQNKLKFKKKSVPLQEEKEQGRVFSKLFNEFEIEDSKQNDKYYFQQKRMIGLVDRRDSSKKVKNEYEKEDTVYLYEPPANCLRIPSDAVNEWYISSSKTCLLPNMEYGDGKAAIAAFDPKSKDLQEQEKSSGSAEATKENLMNANIGSSFHCKGALLTISFHVKSTEEIKCYLYWNGEMTRFMPGDIKTLFPLLFYMNNENKEFMNNEEIDNRIEAMNKILRDVNFEGFRQSYMHK